MKTITDIKQQVKRQQRYSVYVDGKYSFSLSEHELLLQGLRIGQEFDESAFNQVQETAVEDKAYMRALDLLARRPRSQWEMEQYLKRKGYEHNTIDKILSKLTKRGLLDDQKFAESWVSDRRLLKSVSKRRLLQELQQKHVSHIIAEHVIAQDEVDEVAVLRELIAKKRTQTRYQDSQKLMAYLLRQGFSYADVKSELAEH